MEMLYTNRGLYNYIDVNMGDRQIVEENGFMYKVRMLEKNQISFLISPYENEIDGIFYLRYNTESSYVLERLMQKVRPDGDFLKLIITQIFSCVNEIAGYLLSQNDIVINPAYMFFDYDQKKLKLICVPGYDKSITLQIKDFLEYIMRIFDHRDQDGVKYLYELYEAVTEEGFSLKEYTTGCLQQKQAVSGGGGVTRIENAESVKRITANTTVKEEDENKEVFEEEWGINRDYVVVAVMFALTLVIGAKYVLGGRNSLWLLLCIVGFVLSAIQVISALGRTRDEQEMDESMAEYVKSTEEKNVVQSDYEMINQTFRLVPLNNGSLEPLNISERIREISIGRGKNENSYRLSGSQISRLHARVYKRNSDLYLKDAGSTNGTFVNSVRLGKDEEIKLNRGDVVAFATEEFFVS